MMNRPIIFIDDDEDDLSLLKELAMEAYSGATILTFEGPLQVIEFLEKIKIAPLFILSDVNMPKLNGFELRRKLLSMQPAVRRTPFILLSSSKSSDEVLQARLLHVRGFYKKANSVAGMKSILYSIQFMLRLCHKNRFTTKNSLPYHEQASLLI